MFWQFMPRNHAKRQHCQLDSKVALRRETAELAVDRHIRSGNVVGLGTGLIVRTFTTSRRLSSCLSIRTPCNGWTLARGASPRAGWHGSFVRPDLTTRG